MPKCVYLTLQEPLALLNNYDNGQILLKALPVKYFMNFIRALHITYKNNYRFIFFHCQAGLKTGRSFTQWFFLQLIWCDRPQKCDNKTHYLKIKHNG